MKRSHEIRGLYRNPHGPTFRKSGSGTQLLLRQNIFEMGTTVTSNAVVRVLPGPLLSYIALHVSQASTFTMLILQTSCRKECLHCFKIRLRGNRILTMFKMNQRQVQYCAVQYYAVLPIGKSTSLRASGTPSLKIALENPNHENANRAGASNACATFGSTAAV